VNRAAREIEWAAVIVNHNGSVFLDPCLRSLTGMIHPPARIVVVDNNSADDSLLELHSWPRVEVEASPVNLGYAGGANLGVSRTSEPVVVVLNPDVELDGDFGRALERLFAGDIALGAAGAKLRFPSSRVIQHAGGVLHWPLLTTSHIAAGEEDMGQADTGRDVDYVTGAAIALRREAFDAVGGFDGSFYPAYFEDLDLCVRLRRAGWTVRYEPELSGEHHEGGSTGRSADYYRFWHRNRIRFALKHLSPDQWWREFIPAEVDRLRGELSAISRDWWTVTSGAETWEIVARAGTLPDAASRSTLNPGALLNAIAEIQSVVPPASIDVDPIDYRATFAERVRHWVMSWRLWRVVDRALWRQQRFNDSVVRALHAQDRLNRELCAQILLTLILLGVAPSDGPDERGS
jgi:O-antigen biosynthesis protein